MLLEPLTRETTADACTRRLKRAILVGEVPAGDRLPPERELASQLGVNRVTLRTALARLSASGLLVARQGSGTRVVDYRRAGGPELLGELAALAGTADRPRLAADLLAARRGIARAVFERLAEVRPDPAPVAAAVERFAAVAARGGSSRMLADADLVVTAAVVDATGSPVFALCMNPVVAALAAFPALREALYRDPEENVRGWRAFVAWLGEPSLAAIELVLAGMEARDVLSVASVAGGAAPTVASATVGAR